MISNPYECSAVPRTAPCKVCGSLAKINGVVDFSRCGLDVLAGKKVEPYDGIPVYYYLCSHCSFAFTCAFDHWTTDDFARHVYNADYPRHDPEYLDQRPRDNSAWIHENFGGARGETSVLDYGSGLGLLKSRLAEFGFGDVDSFDPFTSPERPRRQYDMVTCFEVFEHSTEPAALMADLKSLLTTDGAVLFSTMLCTPEVIEQGIGNWWYCAPRNGHVSFYSAQALTELGRQHGFHFGSFNDARHVFYKDGVAAWLKPHIVQYPA